MTIKGQAPSEFGSDGKPTETQRLYRLLKEAILANTYQPGEVLQEARIAAEFQSSRTPVREAFQRLEADGLLNIVPRRGAFVQRMTVREFLDINELRLLLEPFAARQATATLPAKTIADFQDRLAGIRATNPTADDSRSLETLDGDLHEAIANALSNIRLAKLLDSLNDMMLILRHQDMQQRHVELHTSIGDILLALQERNGDDVERLMKEHIAAFSGSLRNIV